MKTKIIEIEYPQKPRDEELLEGARILREGGLVAFPTETVYGLGANALDEEAARKIYEAKGRPSDNPLIAHVSCMEEAVREARNAAATGDKVVLSPACASFDLYPNFEARGRHFKELVNAL